MQRTSWPVFVARAAALARAAAIAVVLASALAACGGSSHSSSTTTTTHKHAKSSSTTQSSTTGGGATTTASPPTMTTTTTTSVTQTSPPPTASSTSGGGAPVSPGQTQSHSSSSQSCTSGPDCNPSGTPSLPGTSKPVNGKCPAGTVYLPPQDNGPALCVPTQTASSGGEPGTATSGGE
jgi:hypothetical protein